MTVKSTNDPAMVKKGWLPTMTILLVTLIVLFSAGTRYGNLRQADIEVVSSLSMTDPGDEPCQEYSDQFEFPVKCDCIVGSCANEYAACVNDDTCNANDTILSVLLVCLSFGGTYDELESCLKNDKDFKVPDHRHSILDLFTCYVDTPCFAEQNMSRTRYTFFTT